MTFPHDFERRIGFDQIRERLRSYALCPLGLKHIEALHWMAGAGAVKLQLDRTNEMVTLVSGGDQLATTDFIDPTEWLQFASVEGVYLEAEALGRIKNALLSIGAWVKLLTQHRDSAPALFTLADNVVVPAGLIKSIESKINDEFGVRDHASPELSRIRKKIQSEMSRAKSTMDAIWRMVKHEGFMAEDAQPAFRDGRAVLPLPAEHKRKIRGIIVDESATGQTVFVEPAEVLEINNEIRDLIHAARREEIKILKEITGEVRGNLPRLNQCFDFLGSIDFTLAKSKLARLLEAHKPIVVAGPALTWMEARHPILFLLLKGNRPLVPLNVKLDASQRILLVSGPNAGGKSVCLKTVGLLQYMLQCGLLVPASPDSQFGIFQELLLDIGDQQSLENDLSTYSSHLRNMARFLTVAGPGTLLLIDEMGSGTDPNFGGRIAEAILSQLVDKGAWGVVTTHYYNLKTMAANKPGIVNGAMLFDTKKLEPLFMLEVGKPGSSFAMELASKSNLPSETLQLAKGLVGEGLTGLESLMNQVAADKVKVAQEMARLENQKRQLQSELARYQSLAKNLESKKREIIDKAKLEAAELLKGTNKQIEKTIRHIRENKAEKKETLKVRGKLEQLKDEIIQKKAPAIEKKEFVAGDYVRIPGQELSGKIVSIKGKKALVQAGNISMEIALNQLVASDSKELPAATNPSRVQWQGLHTSFTHTLDLRGKRGEEALKEVDDYMDRALVMGAGEVRVLHGKGEGILRKLIREKLLRTKGVLKIEDEHADRGGAGITVVSLHP